jgi:hypothetical protein
MRIREVSKVLRELDGGFSRGDYGRLTEMLVQNDPLFVPALIQLLQITGIYVPEEFDATQVLASSTSKRQGSVRFSEVCALLGDKPLRLFSDERGNTPFTFKANRLHLDDQALDIPFKLVQHTNNDRNSGYYFPNRDGKEGLTAIRFNPRNLGRCIGACVFCQRAFQLPTISEKSTRKDWESSELVDSIVDRYGEECIPKIEHALLATELYGAGDVYLDFAEDLFSKLRSSGFRGKVTILAQEIRSEEEIRRLGEICDWFDFCYTLECFQRRKTIMGKGKNLPMNEVNKILSTARSMPFQSVRINYILGLDELVAALDGLTELAEAGLIDTIGLNTFVPYTDGQLSLRCKEGSQLAYYGSILERIRDLGIDIHQPNLYERAPGLIDALFNEKQLVLS